MTVKILGIHSSPRNGATAAALRYALSKAKEIEGVETEFADLRKGAANPCLHCGKCIKEKLYYCAVHNDAISPLYEKIREADGIILASPVYNMGPTPQLTALISRLYPLGKCISTGEWGRKVGCGISVGGCRNGGEETTLAVINRYFLTQGMVVAGAGVYAYSGASVWSNDRHDDRVITEDERNRMVITAAVRRMAITARLIKTGIEATPELQGLNIAGFIDEEERAAYLDAFWNRN